MPTFFRRLRKRLLDIGAAKKYLLYAVGEILLVMIGILLALQVNNWNENQNIRNLELKLLSEMKSALLIDKEEYLVGRVKRSRMYVAYVDDLLHILDNDLSYHDSLGYKFRVLTNATGISLSTGAYNSLESVGVQIIQNDTLRQKVVALYTQSIPYLEYTYQNNRNNVLNFGRPLLRTEFKDASGTYVPLDFEKLRQGVLLYNVLKSLKGNNQSILNSLERVSKEMERIIELIDYELG